MAEIPAAMLSNGDTVVTDYNGPQTVHTVEHFNDAGESGVQVEFFTGLVQLYSASERLPLVSTHVEREESGR